MLEQSDRACSPHHRTLAHAAWHGLSSRPGAAVAVVHQGSEYNHMPPIRPRTVALPGHTSACTSKVSSKHPHSFKLGACKKCFNSGLENLLSAHRGLGDWIPFAHRPTLWPTALASRRRASIPAARTSCPARKVVAITVHAAHASLSHANITTARVFRSAIERRPLPVLTCFVLACTRRIIRHRVLVPIVGCAALAARSGARISTTRTPM